MGTKHDNSLSTVSALRSASEEHREETEGGTLIRQYFTRIDEFRRRENIDRAQWAERAAMRIHALERLLAGQDARVSTAARLVRSATQLLGRDVRASELWDLGEDGVQSKRAARKRMVAFPNALRKQYDTRLDRLLVRERIVPAELAREAGISRQTLRHLRAATQEPQLSVVARLVRALRQLTGQQILARHIDDLGERVPDAPDERPRAGA